jgi:hypothetical protein
MTPVAQLVPQAGTVEVGEVIERLRGAPRDRAEPFDSLRIDFSDAVSRAIFSDPRARAFPALIAAAFWLRRSSISRLAKRFDALEVVGMVRMPRGLAFHVPPSNVETLFVYPLMTSFLVGNLNVVRVPARRSEQEQGLLCDALRTALAQERFAEFEDELAVLAYDHQPAPTIELSREADVRLLWGGDQTIDRLRAVPIGPLTHELVFGDRFSFAVLRPEALVGADDALRRMLAERLFNDSYSFDQLACSSPRLVVWVGDSSEVSAARKVLFEELAGVLEHNRYTLPPGTSIAKLTFVHRALIDRPVERVARSGSGLFWLSLADLDDFDRDHPGGGLFFDARVNELADLRRFVRRKDQTLAVLGFSTEELMAFVRSVHGRGVDRIVPLGESLAFGSVWDGYDLLAELTRTISVRGYVPASNPTPDERIIDRPELSAVGGW